jgi:benzoylformate decarboxylase
VREHLAGSDVVLVLGAPVFRYHVHRPGAWLPPGTSLGAVGAAPGSAARAAFGDALVGDVGEVVAQLLAALPAAPRPPRPDRPRRPAADAVEPVPGALRAADVFAEMARQLPEDVRFVNESTSNTPDFWRHLSLARPRGLFRPAAGGLGFGLPAAVGVALADPRRPVVAVLGDGAFQYGVVGLWTAAQWDLPVTFVVLRNGGYGVLQSFLGTLGLHSAPGLELPGLDAVAIARGYGVTATRIADRAELAEALADTAAARSPRVLEVPITAELRQLG